MEETGPARLTLSHGGATVEPPTMTNRPRISFYAAPDVERWLKQQAERAGVSVCEPVKRIVERAAEEDKK